jgi:tetratricopeptide (TPR) repeat protein
VFAQGRDGADGARLCPSDDTSKVTVLMGRFLEFGASPQAETESIITFSALSVLQRIPNIAAFRLQTARQTALAGPDFHGVFIGGVREDAKTRDLSTTLASYGCRYLLGGQISQQGPLRVLTPYLLDTEKGRVVSPFEPFFFDNVGRVGERVAQELESYLRQEAAAGTSNVPAVAEASFRLELGCMDAARPGLGDFSGVAEAIRAGISNRIGRSRRIQRGNSFSAAGRCLDVGPQTLRNRAFRALPLIVLHGEWNSAADVLTIEPIVSVLASGDMRANPAVLRLPRVEVRIPANTPSAGTFSLSAKYNEAVLSVLANITDDLWRIPFDPGEIPTLAGDALGAFVNTRIRQKQPEAAVFAAYRAYSQDPRDTYANYFLSKALLAKGEDDTFVLDHLGVVERTADRLPASIRAEFYEDHARALTRTRRIREAVEALDSASRTYDGLGKADDSARVRRAQARLYFQLGGLDRARGTLSTQPDLKSDIDSLLALIRLEVAAERYPDAEKWISTASSMEQTPRVKRELAGVTAALGARYVEATLYEQAIRQFRLSLGFLDMPSVRYSLGHALLKNGNFAESAREYETLLFRGPATRLEPALLEGAWLNLLEGYLLDGNRALDRRAEEVNQALAASPRALIIANYLIVVSRLLRDVYPTGNALEEDPNHRSLLALLEKRGEDRLPGWDNRQIDDKVDESPTLSEARRDFIRNLTARIFPNYR